MKEYFERGENLMQKSIWFRMFTVCSWDFMKDKHKAILRSKSGWIITGIVYKNNSFTL